MKKTLGSFFVAGCLLALPLGVSAATNKVVEPINCTTDSTSGLKSCDLVVSVDSSAPVTSLNFTLTEVGGADIQEVLDSSTFSVTSDENNGVWTVIARPISIPEWSGQDTVFTYKYMPSGQSDCLIQVNFNGVTYEEKATTTESKTDTPTENKKTGSTLPYIALGGSLIIASSVYVATKKKKKFYKI